MRRDPALVREVQEWLQKAVRNLATGDWDLKRTPPVLEYVAFHAQQAAEKALKAMLTWHGIQFRKTHDISDLGESLREIDPSLGPLLERAERLTKYAWTYRYPGAPHEPEREEAVSALALAREVYEAVLSRVPAETHPPSIS